MAVIRARKLITDADIPAAIARDTETAAAITAHVAAINPHTQYLFTNPSGIEFASSTFNYLDFHTGSTYKDFDARLIARGGGATNGLGSLLLQAGLFEINANINLNGGAQLVRFLSTSLVIDTPAIGAGAVWQTNQNISGAAIGDLALFIPLAMPANLPLFNIQAIVSATEVATIYFHNLAPSVVDLSAFSGRLLVLGF